MDASVEGGGNDRVFVYGIEAGVRHSTTTSVTFEVSCEAAAAEVGTLEVTTVTTGPEEAWDPDGYIVRVDEAGGVGFAINETKTYGEVAVGDHAVDLMNVWGQCTVTSDNPQAVTITEG